MHEVSKCLLCKVINIEFNVYYIFSSLIGSDSNLISIDSLEEARFVSNSLKSRLSPLSDLVREVDRIWFVNAHTALYRDGQPAFASGTPLSRIASALPFRDYVPPPEPAAPATCTESNSNDRADECIALYINDSGIHSLVLIDCNKRLSPGIICKRPKKDSTTQTKKFSSHTAGNEAQTSVPRWPNSSIYVHTLTSSNVTIEYRAIFMTDCPSRSWYCARHRCAASGGQLAALDNPRELREVFDCLKDVLKEYANRTTQSESINSSVLYLHVHRHLYSPDNEEQVSADGEINDDEQAGKAGKYFWSTGSAFTEQSLSSCDNVAEQENVINAENECKYIRTQCGGLRLVWDQKCEDFLANFLPVQCNASPPQPLNAISLCSRVMPQETSASTHLSHLSLVGNDSVGWSFMREASERRANLSAIGFAFVAFVLALMFVYTVMSFAFAFFLRENRDRDQARGGHGRRGHGYEGFAPHGNARELHVNGSGNRGPEREPEYMQLASYRTGDNESTSGSHASPQLGIQGASSSQQIPQPNTDTPSNTTPNDISHSAADQLSETVAVEGTG